MWCAVCAYCLSGLAWSEVLGPVAELSSLFFNILGCSLSEHFFASFSHFCIWNFNHTCVRLFDIVTLLLLLGFSAESPLSSPLGCSVVHCDCPATRLVDPPSARGPSAGELAGGRLTRHLSCSWWQHSLRKGTVPCAVPVSAQPPHVWECGCLAAGHRARPD